MTLYPPAPRAAPCARVGDRSRSNPAPQPGRARRRAAAHPRCGFRRPGARSRGRRHTAVRLSAATRPRSARIATLDWEALEAGIRDCRACALCERRKQAVPGVGDRQARWMLVGEAPGAEEDQRGEPFVGQAGRLLDNMLAAIGLKRGEDVYIANAVKCRPPHNRTPERGEIAACLPYLDAPDRARAAAAR